MSERVQPVTQAGGSPGSEERVQSVAQAGGSSGSEERVAEEVSVAPAQGDKMVTKAGIGLAILTATYNEAGNIEALLTQLRAVAPDATLAVVDDASSDGTAEILTRLQAADPRLKVIGRPGKLGIGSAHKDGIRWAYAAGFTSLVTLDADFTHIPADVPRMLAAAEGKHVAIGSRFTLRESLETWSMFRRIVTRAAHLATRILLGIPYDCSGSFRVYRLDAIPESFWNGVAADDYGFFFESLYRLHAAGHPIAQIPILLPARASGSSKMSPRDAISGLAHLLGFAWHMRRHMR